MATDIGPKIGLDGEQQFKNALQTTIQRIKTLQSSMVALASDFKAGNISQGEYEKESKKLQGELNGQRDKLKDLQGELDDLADKYGENDSSVNKWQRQLNEGIKTANSASTSVDKLGDETKDTGKEMDTASEKTSGWSDVLKGNLLSSAITSGISAIASAVREVSKAIVDAVKDSAAFADEILTLSAQTGVETDKLQELSYAADLVDVNVETVTKAMAKNIKSMTNAAKGTGTAADAYSALGVEVTNADGSLRDSETVFWELIDALGKVDDETTRDSLSMSIFSKSAQELNPLILAGSEIMAELADEAHNVGYVLDSDTLASLGGTQDAMDRLSLSTDSLKRKFTASFAPDITSAVESINTELGKLIKAYDEGGLEGLVGEISDLVSTVSEELSDEETVAELVEAAKSVLSTFGQAIVDNLPLLFSASLSIVTQLATYISDNTEELSQSAVTLITELSDSLIENLPSLMEAGQSIGASLATAVTSPENLTSLAEAGMQLILEVLKGFVLSVPRGIETVLLVIKNIILAIGTLWGEAIEKGKELVTKILSGISEKVSDVIESGKEIVSNVWEGFKQKVEDAKQWGKDLIKNFIDGLKQKWEDLKQGVKDIAQGIANFLGFSEPKEGPLSNFHTYAPDMMQLFAKGIADNENIVRRQLAKSFNFDSILGNASIQAPTAPAAASTSNNFNISLTINGAGISDPQALADIVIDRLSTQISNARGVYA